MPKSPRISAPDRSPANHPFSTSPTVAPGPRIALYSRVSTLDQTPEQQGAELRAWAARQGGAVVLEAQETGSGATNGRPGLQRLLTMAQRGQLDSVAVWKLDRFGRSALDVLSNIRRLTDAGVTFHCITQGITVRPGGDAMSTLLLTMLSAVSEFERSLIVERTRLGLARARARGQRLGRPKLPHPDPARVVALRREGKSWAAIAAELNCSTGAARRRAAEEGTPLK